jgi:hypothetical protein
LNTIPGHPLHVTPVPDQNSGLRLLRHGSTDAVLVINPSSTTDHLLLAGAQGAATGSTEAVLQQAEAMMHRQAMVTDVVPAQSGDAHGMTGCYLVIAWIVGGYLAAAALGMAKGAKPKTTRQALIRLTAICAYAAISGLAGAVVVEHLFGAITGHLWALWGIGTLLVLAVATTTFALQALLGTLGVAVSVILFLIIGNPSSGGPQPPALLPPFWRALSGVLPNGAGIEAVRRAVYFGGHGIAANLSLLTAYLVAGLAIAVFTVDRRARRAVLRQSVTQVSG